MCLLQDLVLNVYVCNYYNTYVVVCLDVSDLKDRLICKLNFILWALLERKQTHQTKAYVQCPLCCLVTWIL